MSDDDFGMPCPGAIVVQAEWTQPRLDRLPTQGPFEFEKLFGRPGPVVLDLGCGNGRFLVAAALARPEANFLGVDTVPVVVRHAVERVRRRGLAHVKLAVADAREVVSRLLPPGSVHEMHFYHPQPYFDLAYVHRRLFTAAFMAQAVAALAPGGLFIVQTDNPGYWNYLNELIPLFLDWQPLAGPWPDAPAGRTRREILARQQGLAIYRGLGTLPATLDLPTAIRRAEALPPPVFSADRRLRELERQA
ncbi:MAG TPA: methyltransferase domain-containing protein [Gemmatales bacterium]|nr:methyltransferase domain-containing protein [Gemmatales bacterium]HMP61306.1 methyltransferase domain-containing protein [Gemmatales bacterium]